MVILFFIALVLAWPTYGLSLAGYFALVVVRAFLQAKSRRHEARQLGAGRDLLAGSSSHPPSWIMQEDRRDEFLHGVRKLTLRNGLPESFVRGMFEDKRNFKILIHYVGLLEDRGGSFTEQQMAASEVVKKMWLKQGKPELFAPPGTHDAEAVEEESSEAEQEVPRQPSASVGSCFDDERASLHKEGAQHFISDDDEAEGRYIKGVLCLRRGDYDGANDNFKAAASKGHVSAYWNLAILIGSGRVTPFDIDYAADCFRAAAGGGHPTANKWIYMLDAADRGGFGYDNLERMIAAGGSQDDLPAILIVCACRFTHVLCTQHGVTDEVIDYELPAAAKSDNPAIREFVRRTGIDLPRRPMRWVNESPDDSHMEFFSPDLEEGSPADGITDGFNQITVALMRAGYSDELATFARCTVLGYVISKSARGTHAKPLLGLEQFFEYEDEELDLTEK